MPRSRPSQRPAGLWLAIGAAAACLEIGPARASVPTGPPTFSDPLNITNPFHPFVPGAVKVFGGHDTGDRTVIVDLYLPSTRTFSLGGDDVETHILQETEFAEGVLSEISRNYFAQADDGTVYYFGEVVDEYENGAVVGHSGSWLVGGPTHASDPPTTADATAPTVFMPAQPEVGDVFKAEDLPPIVDETDTVKAVGENVQVAAGRFRNAIQVVETTSLDEPPETKWYVPGVGVVKGKTKGERFALAASSLNPQ